MGANHVTCIPHLCTHLSTTWRNRQPFSHQNTTSLMTRWVHRVTPYPTLPSYGQTNKQPFGRQFILAPGGSLQQAPFSWHPDDRVISHRFPHHPEPKIMSPRLIRPLGEGPLGPVQKRVTEDRPFTEARWMEAARGGNQGSNMYPTSSH